LVPRLSLHSKEVNLNGWKHWSTHLNVSHLCCVYCELKVKVFLKSKHNFVFQHLVTIAWGWFVG
jgi:hypothetical protein